MKIYAGKLKYFNERQTEIGDVKSHSIELIFDEVEKVFKNEVIRVGTHYLVTFTQVPPPGEHNVR